MQNTCIKTLPSINYNSFHERATDYYILFTIFSQNKNIDTLVDIFIGAREDYRPTASSAQPCSKYISARGLATRPLVRYAHL